MAYVVQIAATGSCGYPTDTVAEIAVCLVNGKEFDTVYSDTVAIDPLDVGKQALDYLEENHGIVSEDLYAGSPLARVAEDFREIVYGEECTAFDIGNVFGRYLSFEPWNATGNVTLLPSVGARLPSEFRGPPETEVRRLAEAYCKLCPDDSAMVGEGRRAVHLAHMASSLLILLRDKGLA